MGRTLSVTVSAQVPLVALTPFIIRELGALDPEAAYAGYQLQRMGRETLDPAQSLAAQGVNEGERLNLVRSDVATRPRRYDDMVEAVIEATGRRTAWTSQDRARTALGVSLTLLALGAALLVVSPRGSILTAMLALGGALALVATGAVLTRVKQPEAGHGLGLAGAVYGGVGAYLLTPGETLWSWPLASAGLGVLVVGGIALAASGSSSQVHLVPIAVGAALGITSAVAALVADGGPAPIAPYALLVAALGAISNALPWMVLTSTRLAVISPQSEPEIFADTPEPDGDEIGKRASQGHALQLALRIAFGLTVLAVTPMVASAGVAGALLCTLVFLGMMFESRQVYARAEVAALMGLATVGLAVTGTVIAVSGSIDLTWLLGSLLVAAVGLVGIAMLTEGTSIRLIKLYDTVEMAALAALIPLGVVAAGLV
ncbi:MAG: EsaB/YukD family protein [Micrococcales bacterium]|nr:EsaB/YukD family protein [Micrococcales bacterium]